MTEFAGKKPYQPDDFLRDNRNVITSVFPNFFESLSTGENEIIDPELQYKTLEDRVLAVTSHEPAMQLLGRERFMTLPQEQRFQLVKDSLGFISAINEAKQQIVE
jgi:hypothetical protein